jgi:hypothetical protein
MKEEIKKDYLDIFATRIAKLRLTELGFYFIPALRVLIEANTKRISAKALIVK